jgi:hypothetical protein
MTSPHMSHISARQQPRHRPPHIPKQQLHPLLCDCCCCCCPCGTTLNVRVIDFNLSNLHDLLRRLSTIVWTVLAVTLLRVALHWWLSVDVALIYDFNKLQTWHNCSLDIQHFVAASCRWALDRDKTLFKSLPNLRLLQLRQIYLLIRHLM